jgi:sec-independent protein translocase protein TatA
MNELRPWHIIVLVVVLFVLFGYKKLPDATRSLGRSLRILKSEVKTLHDTDGDKADKAADKEPAELPAGAIPPPVGATEKAAPRKVAAPR